MNQKNKGKVLIKACLLDHFLFPTPYLFFSFLSENVTPICRNFHQHIHMACVEATSIYYSKYPSLTTVYKCTSTKAHDTLTAFCEFSLEDW